MKSLSIAILYVGCLAAIIFAPDFWFIAGLIGFFGTVAIDEVE